MARQWRGSLAEQAYSMIREKAQRLRPGEGIEDMVVLGFENFHTFSSCFRI
jgi:hypothetical protein